jgi:hypothetical protein
MATVTTTAKLTPITAAIDIPAKAPLLSPAERVKHGGICKLIETIDGSTKAQVPAFVFANVIFTIDPIWL